MVAKVVGFERVEFPTKDGDMIKGTRVYVTYENKFISGKGTDFKYFADNSDIKLPEFVIGKDYDFVYQEKGFTGKAVLVAVNPV